MTRYLTGLRPIKGKICLFIGKILKFDQFWPFSGYGLEGLSDASKDKKLLTEFFKSLYSKIQRGGTGDLNSEKHD